MLDPDFQFLYVRSPQSWDYEELYPILSTSHNFVGDALSFKWESFFASDSQDLRTLVLQENGTLCGVFWATCLQKQHYVWQYCYLSPKAMAAGVLNDVLMLLQRRWPEELVNQLVDIVK